MSPVWYLRQCVLIKLIQHIFTLLLLGQCLCCVENKPPPKEWLFFFFSLLRVPSLTHLHYFASESGSRLLLSFLPGPHSQQLHPHACTLNFRQHDTQSDASGLTHGVRRRRHTGFCSEYVNHYLYLKIQSSLIITVSHNNQVIAFANALVAPSCCLGSRRNLRNDLLVAADSITSTMSSLVKELHSGKRSIA